MKALDTVVAIAVLPYGCSLGAELAKLNLDALTWPLGRPKRLASGVVADLQKTDHLIVFPKTSMHLKINWGTKANVSLMVVEPRDIHRRHFQLLKVSGRRFYRIFTHDSQALNSFSNARFLPAASTWVPEYQTLKIDKTTNISLIASQQNTQTGHRLRHEIVEKLRLMELDVDIIGRGYKPFEHKAEGLSPYRFSIVIENARNEAYFTEKIVDSLLCETIPIYWGAPNIADFFDGESIIECETPEDIIQATIGANKNQYEKMRPSLMKAKKQAIKVIDYKILAAEAIRDGL